MRKRPFLCIYCSKIDESLSFIFNVMRMFNFSAGPAALPAEVLQQAADEMLDWQGTGISVMEMSHRRQEFESIHQAALDDLRDLLNVPQSYRILFLQGGGAACNAHIPLNLLGSRCVADYVITGLWSHKSLLEARRYCNAHLAASNEASGFTHIPAVSQWRLSENAAYVHICTNETAHGIEFFDVPDVGDTPLVADASSHLLSRPMDVTQFGVLYGGAQKNIGIAGLTLVIVHEDLLQRALPICPSVFEWKTVAARNSMLNTPPTWAIYISGLVFKWLRRQGGLEAMEKRNIEKARYLYAAIDGSDFYHNAVDPSVRSRMNVPFHLADETRCEAFLAGANARGLTQLKGHTEVGGIRASLYNAVPLEAVHALVDYMKEFERQYA